MFTPVSGVQYYSVNVDRQILICSLGTPSTTPALLKKWGERACAVFEFRAGDDLCGVVRDLLANPQIRAIVFDGEGGDACALRAFWRREVSPDWGISPDHLELVRQFVDLFDEDCSFHQAQQPFWPERLKYTTPPQNP